jgi:hypothetical protein
MDVFSFFEQRKQLPHLLALRAQRSDLVKTFEIRVQHDPVTSRT